MNDQIITQLIVAGFTTQLFEWIKKWKAIPQITALTTTLNRWIGILVAVAMGLGITFNFDSQAHTLLISGLSWTLIGNALWAMVVQWVMQQGWYGGLTKTPVQAVVPKAAVSGKGVGA